MAPENHRPGDWGLSKGSLRFSRGLGIIGHRVNELTQVMAACQSQSYQDPPFQNGPTARQEKPFGQIVDRRSQRDGDCFILTGFPVYQMKDLTAASQVFSDANDTPGDQDHTGN